jgi:hypothetical protein
MLPFTQFEVTARWRLASCERGAENIVLLVSAAASAQDDPQQRYVINPSSLQRALTRSSFDIEYHEGSSTIKSINTDVEDRTAEFVSNIVAIAGKVASAGGFPAVPPPGRGPASVIEDDVPPAPVETPLCTSFGREALARIAPLEDALEQANGQVAGASDEVARLGAIVAQLGAGVDPQTAARYAAALERLDGLTASQADLASRLEDALNAISVSTTLRWPEQGNQFTRDEPLTIPAGALARWFQDPAARDARVWPKSYLAIRPVTGELPASSPGGGPARVAGIPYRVSVRGRLVSCETECGRAHGPGQRVVVEGTVAQLGGVAVLPVRNQPLGSSEFGAEFNRDGTLVSAGFAQRRAPLEAASEMAADATDTLAPLFDPTQRLQRETAYLEALQERRAAADALTPAAADPTADATAALAAENTLLEAQISNLQARITLRELEARAAQR